MDGISAQVRELITNDYATEIMRFKYIIDLLFTRCRLFPPDTDSSLGLCRYWEHILGSNVSFKADYVKSVRFRDECLTRGNFSPAPGVQLHSEIQHLH